jgi:hypothetical protein
MSEVKFFSDRHFEETLVQALIIDNIYAEQMLEVLDVNYFNIEHLKVLTRIIF